MEDASLSPENPEARDTHRGILTRGFMETEFGELSGAKLWVAGCCAMQQMYVPCAIRTREQSWFGALSGLELAEPQGQRTWEVQAESLASVAPRSCSSTAPTQVGLQGEHNLIRGLIKLRMSQCHSTLQQGGLSPTTLHSEARRKGRRGGWQGQRRVLGD